jgi:hypothetical protein
MRTGKALAFGTALSACRFNPTLDRMITISVEVISLYTGNTGTRSVIRNRQTIVVLAIGSTCVRVAVVALKYVCAAEQRQIFVRDVVKSFG